MRSLFVALLAMTANGIQLKNKQADYGAQADAIIAQYDIAGNDHEGKVTWDEVVAASPNCTGRCKEKGKEMFNQMDADGSGMIDRDELIEFLEHM